MVWGMLDNDEMKSLKALIFSVALSTVLMAEDGKCPPVAPEVDPGVALELRLDRMISEFDKGFAASTAKPTLLGIKDLKSWANRISACENESISDNFRLTGGRSVRSIASSELSAHLDIIKSVKKVVSLLDEAREAAEAHQEHVARVRLTAASKEFASTRKLLAEKRKMRSVHASKVKADTKPQLDSKAKKPDGDKPEMAVKAKKA